MLTKYICSLQVFLIKLIKSSVAGDNCLKIHFRDIYENYVDFVVFRGTDHVTPNVTTSET